MKVLIVYYSMQGHTHRMAESVAAGAMSVKGTEVVLRRVPETLSEETLIKLEALEAQKKFAHVPICTIDELTTADAIIFGSPTHFGNMCSQMSHFLDGTVELMLTGALIGKVGSVFVSSATRHGGQESTILNLHTSLLHQGMIIVGLPYSYKGLWEIEEIGGGSPYGASTICGIKGERLPNKNELDGARFQGRHVAKIVSKLFR